MEAMKETKLKKGMFFTTNGSDIWVVGSINRPTVVDLHNLTADDRRQVCLADDQSGELEGFTKIEMPTIAKKRGRRPDKQVPFNGTAAKPKKRGRKPVARAAKKPPPPGRKKSRPSSKYYGVCLKKGKWSVDVWCNGKKHYGGVFDVEEDAARAADTLREKLGLPKANHDLLLETETENLKAQLTPPGKQAWECQGCGYDCQGEGPPDVCPKCNRGTFERIIIKQKMVFEKESAK